MIFTFTTLGTSAAGPIPGRWASAQHLRVGKKGLLFDCGEGTQIVLQKQGIGWSSVHAILISHLHGDHIYGLPGLLSFWELYKRNTPLTIVSPEGLEDMVKMIFKGRVKLSYPVQWVTALPDATPQLVYEETMFQVTTLPLSHRIPAVGYCVRERPLPRTILAAAIQQYDIPVAAIRGIKAGQDYTTAAGIVIPNEKLTTDPPPARAFAYCSDTRPLPALVPLIQDIDLLYHEATFTHDLAQQAEISGHSTAKQAAEIAQAAHVKELVIGHFSPRYGSLSPLLDEARLIFPNTHLAEEGKAFLVPFRGREAQADSSVNGEPIA